MDGYLSKPIEFEKLLSILGEFLKKQSSKNEIKNNFDVIKSKQISKYNKQDAMKQLSLDESTVDMLLEVVFNILCQHQISPKILS